LKEIAMAAPDSASAAPSTKPRTVRVNVQPLRTRTTVAIIATLTLAAAVTLFGAAPAAGTQIPTGEVQFCFKHTNGSPYTQSVTAQVDAGGSWRNRETRRSIDGCFVWPVESGYYWQFRAKATVGRITWSGTTSAVYVKAGMRHNIGVHPVTESSR
jgi:hypothetical protein